MKTECSRCGRTSTIMSPGNGCHNDSCNGIMSPICKQCGYQLSTIQDGYKYQGYCYQCAVDKGIEKNPFDK